MLDPNMGIDLVERGADKESGLNSYLDSRKACVSETMKPEESDKI